VLAQLLPAEVFGFLLVFARIGSALMVLPGIGEPYVFQRVRLALGLAITLAVYALVRGELPALPDQPFRLGQLLLAEIVVGLMIGGAARFMVSALHVAGVIVAFQSGLSYAQTVDPSQGTQGGLVAALFSLLGIVLIFAADLHIPLLAGLADSYRLFPAGNMPPFESLAGLATRLMAASFAAGLGIAAPFVLFGLVFYAGLGLLQRLIPQVQLVMVAMPLQIVLSIGLLMLTLSAGMLYFLDRFRDLSLSFMSPA